MLEFTARSAAEPAAAWSLIARPARWSTWAPHIRGARGLADGPGGEVRVGARGAAMLLGALPVPAQIVAKSARPPLRSWTWRVGPVEMDHFVREDDVPPGAGSRCVVGFTIRAPGPLEAALAVTYGPVMALLARRLAKVAARG